MRHERLRNQLAAVLASTTRAYDGAAARLAVRHGSRLVGIAPTGLPDVIARFDPERVAVGGHSAGGHLSACMVATDFSTLAPDAPADLVPAGYAISGVYDLDPLAKISVNDDLRLTEKSAHDVSPLYWRVPAGRTSR